MKLERRLIGVSSAVMLTAGFLLSSAFVWAEDTSIDEVTITVPSSCTMTGTLNTAHTTSLLSGETANNIGTTTLKVICNDSAGYAIYAIGYTDDVYGKTVLTSSALGSSYDIATATTVTTGTSSWAMKLATSGSSYLPVIVGSTGDSEKESSTPDFSNYVAVPTEYTRVAYRNSATDVGTGALGSSLTTTYRVYVSPVQPAGTYIGQVKYTMVHPSNAEAPIAPLRESDCPYNSICYAPNASDIVGSMDSISETKITSSPTAGVQFAYSYDTAVLIAPNFSRPGYGFAGWSTDFEADSTSTIYGPNEYIETGDLDTNGMILYPVWIASAGNLQGWSGCSSLTTAPTNTRATLASITALKDTRDNNVYAVARLADGKCWMVENLRLDNTATITTTNTHSPLNTNGNVTLKIDYGNNIIADHLASSSNTWCTNSNAACYDQTMLNTSNTNRALDPSYNSSNTYYQWYGYGNYYNWYSATAGNGTYDFSTENNSVIGDLCPASWRLPQGGMAYAEGNTSGVNVTNSPSTYRDFYNLSYILMGSTAYEDEPNNGYSYYSSFTATEAFIKFPNNFVYSGVFRNSSTSDRGWSGSYWSSSAGNDVWNGVYAYILNVYGNGLAPGTDNRGRSWGLSVRCIAQ